MHNYKKTGVTPCFYTIFHQSPPTQRCCFGRLSHKTIKSSRTPFDLHIKSKKSSLFLCTFKIKHYLCIAIEENKSEIRKIVLWCNGSTSVSGTACQGSSPCRTTKKDAFSSVFLFFNNHTIHFIEGTHDKTTIILYIVNSSPYGNIIRHIDHIHI